MSSDRPVRVLHVDDDPATLDLTAAYLERDGLTVESEQHASNGLERLANEHFECVISDFEMPGTDGLEFLDAVRERWPDLPFVLFTGTGSERVASKAISAGVTDYLPKGTAPEGYEMLANRVRNGVERYRTERALECSEERYRRLVETSPAPIVICGPTGEVLYVNNAAAAFVGASDPETVIGEDALGFVHPEDRNAVSERLGKVLADGERFSRVERRFVGRTGEVRHAVVASAPITFEGDPAAQVIFNDRTESRRSDRTLRRERSLIDGALDALADVFYVVNEDNALVRWNDRLNEVTGYTDAELESMSIDDLFGGGIETATSLLETGKAIDAVDLVTKTGDTVPYELRNVEVTGDGATNVCGIARNVAERRRRERDLEQYETIVETIGDGAYTLDTTGHITAVNGALLAETGYTREGLLGEHVSKVMTEADLAAGEAVIRSLLADPTLLGERFEMDLVCADGTTVRCEDHVALLPAADGGYRGTVGVLRDVSERRRRERKLERYETIVETAPLGVFVFDAEGVFIDGNRIGSDNTERGEELIDTSFERIVEEGKANEEAVERYTEVVRSLLSSANDQERGQFEVTIDLADHGERIYRNHLALLPYDEEFEGTVMLTEDVTERKRHEQRLSALHEATRDLMSATSAADVADVTSNAARDVLDLELNSVHLFDERTERLVPVTSTQTALDVIGDPPTFGSGDGLIWEAFETGTARIHGDLGSVPGLYNPDTVLRSELALPLGDHGVFTASSTMPEAFDESTGSLAKVLGANAEAALDRVRRDRLLRERTADLERQNERLDEFASIVSHDLRSPLNVVQGHLALARETDDDAEHLAAIDRATNRMSTLLTELLELAKQGALVSEPEPVSLASVVRDAWAEVETAAATIDVHDELGEIEADRSRLRELLANLVRNAIEHGSDCVSITVRPLENGLSVADNGPGIPVADRERVFTRGYTSNPDGTGFGLAIVETIADAHGWTVSVAESETGGARFDIEW